MLWAINRRFSYSIFCLWAIFRSDNFWHWESRLWHVQLIIDRGQMTLIHRILVVWNWKCAFRLNDFNNLVDDSKIYTCLHVTIFRIIYKFERIVKTQNRRRKYAIVKQFEQRFGFIEINVRMRVLFQHVSLIFDELCFNSIWLVFLRRSRVMCEITRRLR